MRYQGQRRERALALERSGEKSKDSMAFSPLSIFVPMENEPPARRQRWSTRKSDLPGSRQALDDAKKFQRNLSLDALATIKVLNPSCVSGNFLLTLPSSFAKAAMAKGKTAIKVRDASGRKWDMKWNWTHQPMIGAGWKAFCEHHKLVKGDVLVLSKAGSHKLHAEIFHRKNYELKQEEHYDDGNEREDQTRELALDCDRERELASEDASQEAEDPDGDRESDPAILVQATRTRSASESEEMGLKLMLRSDRVDRVCKSLLSSPGVIIQGSCDGALRAKVSREELQRILRLVFPMCYHSAL